MGVALGIVVMIVVMVAAILAAVSSWPKYVAAKRAGEILRLYGRALNYQLDLGNQGGVFIVEKQIKLLGMAVEFIKYSDTNSANRIMDEVEQELRKFIPECSKRQN